MKAVHIPRVVMVRESGPSSKLPANRWLLDHPRSRMMTWKSWHSWRKTIQDRKLLKAR